MMWLHLAVWLLPVPFYVAALVYYARARRSAVVVIVDAIARRIERRFLPAPPAPSYEEICLMELYDFDAELWGNRSDVPDEYTRKTAFYDADATLHANNLAQRKAGMLLDAQVWLTDTTNVRPAKHWTDTEWKWI